MSGSTCKAVNGHSDAIQRPWRIIVEKYIYYAFIAACFVFLVDVSWCRLGELIVDTFRDQIVTHKLLLGQTLYKDIYYLFGILPPHALSFLSRIFGPSLFVSAGVGIVFAAFSSILVYRISRVYLHRFFSTLTTIVFLFVCAFNNINGYGTLNFILPYSVATLFMITFALAALYCFIKFIMSENTAYLFGWALAQYIVFLSRFDITMPVYLLFAVWGIVLFARQRKPLVPVLLAAPALCAAGTYAVYFAAHNNYAAFSDSVVKMMFFQGKGIDPYASWYFGAIDLVFDGSIFKPVYNLASNARLMAVSFFIQAFLVTAFYFTGTGMEYLEKRIFQKRFQKIIMHVLFIAAAVLSAFVLPQFQLWGQYSGLPLFLAAGIVVSAFGLRVDFKKYFSVMLLMLISLAFLSRILFRIFAYPYGALLIVPALICFYVVVADLLPFALKRFSGAGTGKKWYAALVLIFAVTSNYQTVKDSLYWYEMRSFEVPYVNGRMVAYKSPIVSQYMEIIEYIRYNTPETARVVVFPEGQGVNYLSARECPMKYDNYLPNIIKTAGEDNILNELRSKPIDYIVILGRPCFEYGYSYFGRDFGLDIWKWIFENYEPVKQIGTHPAQLTLLDFGALILKKKENI